MAGLLAWAADVVGGPAGSDDEADDADATRAAAAAAMSSDQRLRAAELDARAASLRRAIQDLRLRVPPPHVAQRLPHLHAHSLASSAALALQLSAHSSTKEQAQQREITLQEESAAYEKAISNCQQKIQEKLHEADLLERELKEMEMAEQELKAELEKDPNEQDASQLNTLEHVIDSAENVLLEAELVANVKSKDLEEKKRELKSFEDKVQRLEKEWSLVEEESLKKPTPAQREKALEKQLHSIIEQLTSKQAQAEGLITYLGAKEKDLEKLNSLRRKLEDGINEVNATRNKFGRSFLGGPEAYRRPYQSGVRAESQQKLVLLRSAFVLYILALHIIVFIKISF